MKKKVLVFDNQSLFLRIFKNELVNEFTFSKGSGLITNNLIKQNFNRYIYVVYNKIELIKFLNLDRPNGLVVLVCLFSRESYGTLSFLEEINSLVELRGYKSKKEIIMELKLHFENKHGFVVPFKISKEIEKNIYENDNKFNGFYKTLFLLI